MVCMEDEFFHVDNIAMLVMYQLYQAIEGHGPRIFVHVDLELLC